MASSSSSSAAAAAAPARGAARRLPKRVRPLGDLSLADVIASTIEQFIAFDAPAATCLIYTSSEDAVEEGSLTITLERRTGMLVKAHVSAGDEPLPQARFFVEEFVERVCTVSSSAADAPSDEAVREARARAASVLDLWPAFASTEARGVHAAIVGAKPATETWREGALQRTTTVRRQRADGAAFGAYDDEEADADDDAKMTVVVSERRTHGMFTSESTNAVKRALQARAKMLRTPRQLPVSYIEEGALQASSATFQLQFPGPGGATGVEPAAHARIDAFFTAFA